MVIMKKWLARSILATGLPLIVGVSTDPLGRDGVFVTWCKGAGLLGGAVIFRWAIEEAVKNDVKSAQS